MGKLKDVAEGEGLRDTAMRYLALAQAVPTEPYRRSTGEIVARLQNEGYKGEKRTIERDLNKLSNVFRYTSETTGRTNYWFYPKEARLFEVQGMNAACALALAMSKEFLRPLLPPEMLDLARPYFTRAETVLDETTTKGISAWRKRVQVVSSGPGFPLPKVSAPIQAEVYASVLLGRQLEIEYTAVYSDATKGLTLHPLGIVLKEGVIYVVATALDYDDIRQYAVHRMKSARMIEVLSKQSPGFDLKAYVDREFRYPVADGLIRLQLKVDPGVAIRLSERPLGEDQQVHNHGEYRIVTASVADTEELRWWILGHGPQIEVQKPVALRKVMVKTIRAMTDRYSQQDAA